MMKIKRNKSLVRIFLFSMLFISFVSTAIIGYLWISHEFRKFETDTERMKTDNTEAQKLLIKNEVQRVVDYIGFTRSKTDNRLKELLKERVYEAYDIANSIYENLKNQASEREIKRLIKNALRPIRFNKGRGSFFIYTMEGVLELYPVKPQLEGKNQWYLQDSLGTYLVRNEVELVKKQQEGFLEYKWTDPLRDPEVVFSKVTFVKYFQPLNWYIGSKEYREDFTRDIQRELLERIGKIRFGKDGYVFVVDFDGVTLWNDIRPDLIGKKVWASDDPNGLKAIQQARKAAENREGGYINYTWFKREDKTLRPKTSFIMGIRDWQWIIGAGVYLDEIDHIIAARRVELKREVTHQVIKIIGIFIVIFLVALFITLFFAGKLRKEFGVFLSFFKKSALSFEKIDKEELFAVEFKSLADSANQMLAEREKVENSLRESEERLAVTFRSLAEGVITTDIDHKVVLMNKSAEILIGRDQVQTRGKSLDEVFHIIDEKTKQPLPPFEVSPAITPLLVAGDGSLRLIFLSTASIRDHAGNIVGSVIVFQDITEKKRMEEEIQKAHKLESLGLLAGGIAHDFNNLLSGIIGNISLAALSTSSQDKVAEELAQVEKAAVSARQLAQQLLTFARGGVPVKKVFAVPDFIKEAVSFSLRGSNVKCEFLLPENLWAVEVDTDQVNQVLNNLIINACQAMPNGGMIRVSAKNVPSGKNTGLNLEDKRYVKIAIQDTGCGIPRELLEKIFDPYFSTKSKGSGLGLTLAYSIIKKHDGLICVDSQPGIGSTFSIYIPASDKGSPQVMAENIQDTPEENVPEKKGDGRILVMDDDPFVSDVTNRMLIHLGFRPEVVPEGSQAVESYKRALEMNQPFKAIIMDLTIPGGMGGAEAVREIRKIDPQVKAIVSSGYSNDPIMGNYQEYGFLACIRKPYRLQELKKILEQVLMS